MTTSPGLIPIAGAELWLRENPLWIPRFYQSPTHKPRAGISSRPRAYRHPIRYVLQDHPSDPIKTMQNSSPKQSPSPAVSHLPCLVKPLPAPGERENLVLVALNDDPGSTPEFDKRTTHEREIQQASEEKIRAQFEELLRWQNLMIARENRIRQLKAEVNELLVRLGLSSRYTLEAQP